MVGMEQLEFNITIIRLVRLAQMEEEEQVETPQQILMYKLVVLEQMEFK
jgi:hypothetical protein